MQINQDTLNESAEEILHSLRNLSELLQENPPAYKLCYEVSGRFVAYTEHARLLLTDNQQMNLPLGGY